MGYDYKDYIEQAKKYLMKTSPAFEAFEEYYKKAVKNIGEEYGSSADKINEQHFLDSNKTSARSALDAKNISQYMASRGLSRSGEAEQETINSNLSLNQALSELTRSKYDALSKLYSDKNKALLEMEKEYADKKLKSDDWLYSAAFDLASAQLAEDRRQEETAKKEEEQKAKQEYEEYVRSLEREYEQKLLAEKRAYEDKVRKEEQDFKREMAEYSDKSKETGDESGKYTPSQSPSTIGKNIITSQTLDGKKVSGVSDRVKLEEYINQLKEANVDDAYLGELLMVLKSTGYAPPSDTERKAYGIAASSEEVYDNRRKSYFDMYLLLGTDKEKAGEMADRAAFYSRLDYCYTNSASTEEFAVCCEILGITKAQLDDYLARVNNIDLDSKNNKLNTRLSTK